MMKILQREKNGILICAIQGEINIDTAGQLQKTIQDIAEHKSRKILLNFSEVEYIDSLGMSSLIALKKNIEAMQGVMFFSNVSPKILSIFGITKLEKVFKIFETEREALEGFDGY
jgi:anti-sigma B factor antagonist